MFSLGRTGIEYPWEHPKPDNLSSILTLQPHLGQGGTTLGSGEHRPSKSRVARTQWVCAATGFSPAIPGLSLPWFLLGLEEEREGPERTEVGGSEKKHLAPTQAVRCHRGCWLCLPALSMGCSQAQPLGEPDLAPPYATAVSASWLLALPQQSYMASTLGGPATLSSQQPSRAPAGPGNPDTPSVLGFCLALEQVPETCPRGKSRVRAVRPKIHSGRKLSRNL